MTQHSQNSIDVTNRSLFFRVLLICALPVLEFVFLRWFQSSIARLRIGWPVGTDYDFILPLIWVHFLTLFFFFREKPPALSFKGKNVVFNVILVSVLICFTWIYSSYTTVLVGNMKFIWLALAFFVFLSSYFCFFSPRYFFLHPKRKILPVAFLLAFSIFCYHWIFEGIWHYLAVPTAEALRFFALPLIDSSVVPKFIDSKDILVFPFKEIKILIGRGCGGGEGILIFFICCWGYRLLAKPVGFLKWAIFLPIGVFFIFVVNVARLSFLILLTVTLVRMKIFNAQLFLFWVHANIGLLLYSVAVYTLFYFFRERKVKIRRSTWSRLAESTVLVLFILYFSLGTKNALSAGCNQVCLTALDCPAAGCNVCHGVCVTCETLGNSSACNDVGSGASTRCLWQANACVEFFEVEGIARFLLYLIGTAIIASLSFYRKRQVLTGV